MPQAGTFVLLIVMMLTSWSHSSLGSVGYSSFSPVQSFTPSLLQSVVLTPHRTVDVQFLGSAEALGTVVDQSLCGVLTAGHLPSYMS